MWWGVYHSYNKHLLYHCVTYDLLLLSLITQPYMLLVTHQWNINTWKKKPCTHSCFSGCKLSIYKIKPKCSYDVVLHTVQQHGKDTPVMLHDNIKCVRCKYHTHFIAFSCETNSDYNFSPSGSLLTPKYS